MPFCFTLLLPKKMTTKSSKRISWNILHKQNAFDERRKISTKSGKLKKQRTSVSLMSSINANDPNDRCINFVSILIRFDNVLKFKTSCRQYFRFVFSREKENRREMKIVCRFRAWFLFSCFSVSMANQSKSNGKKTRNLFVLFSKHNANRAVSIVCYRTGTGQIKSWDKEKRSRKWRHRNWQPKELFRLLLCHFTWKITLDFHFVYFSNVFAKRARINFVTFAWTTLITMKRFSSLRFVRPFISFSLRSPNDRKTTRFLYGHCASTAQHFVSFDIYGFLISFRKMYKMWTEFTMSPWSMSTHQKFSFGARWTFFDSPMLGYRFNCVSFLVAPTEISDSFVLLHHLLFVRLSGPNTMAIVHIVDLLDFYMKTFSTFKTSRRY